jgi:hypothetical protein
VPPVSQLREHTPVRTGLWPRRQHLSPGSSALVRGLSATVDFVPQFEFGDVEELECGLGLDAVIVLQDAQYFLHVVDPAFPGSPTGQDVTQGFGERAMKGKRASSPWAIELRSSSRR